MNNKTQRIHILEHQWYIRSRMRNFGLMVGPFLTREHRRHYFISTSSVRGRMVQARINRD
jgi:hypothetical protein